MEPALEKAYAKINLGLDITGRRSDGYHDVRMVMQSLDLHDDVAVYQTRDPAISMDIELDGVTADNSLTTDQHNLCVKAASAISSRLNLSCGLFIFLKKRIPIASGMAGGSTDAAAVLRAVNRITGNTLSAEELREIGADLGADVPFCVEGGTMLCEGIGEILTPLRPADGLIIVAAKPPEGVSTKEVYEAYDAEKSVIHPDIDALVNVIETSEKGLTERAADIAGKIGNVLEAVTVARHPVISTVKQFMKDNGALNALMTGSGPTVYGIFDDSDKAASAAARLRKANLCGTVIITQTITPGTKNL